MSLDIRLSTSRAAALSFEDDGYYWFMYPLIEDLRIKTGQYIDLYGGAAFAGKSLESLRETLIGAAQMVEGMPDRWEVQTGSSIGSYLKPTPPTPIYGTVHKSDFVLLLRAFLELVDTAIARKATVVCAGD